MALTGIVIGGSLGGLNAGLHLRDAGFAVDVFERSPTRLVGHGAGIVLNPATVRYIVDNCVVPPGGLGVSAAVVRYVDPEGRVVAETHDGYSFSSYDAIYRMLIGLFGNERYHLGESVVALRSEKDSATVRLASGRSITADIVVCADGVGSISRARMLPGVRTKYAGYVAWRGIVEADRVDVAARATFHDAITYCVLPNGHALVYPIPGRGPRTADRLNWLWYRNVPSGLRLDVLMTDADGVRRPISLPPGAASPCRVDELRGDARVLLAPQIADLIDATAAPFVQVVVDIDVPRMAFGRVCLIGDAAFACRPHAAAGSAKAAEDSFQLGEALRAARGDVQAALESWEPGQLELGRSLLRRARVAGEQSQFENTWRIGQPLPFGLRVAGDSRMTIG